MKTPSHRFSLAAAVFLSAVLAGAPRAPARHLPEWVDPANIPAREPAALPAEAPPAINPDAVPSASLQPFLDTHLGKILAPLGTPAFAQDDVLADMKSSYAKALAGAPETHKPAYHLAMTGCESLAGAIAERRKAVAAMEGSYDMRSSEAYQPRGGSSATKDSNKNEAFFYDSQKNNWLQSAAALRQQINALYKREYAAEIQAGEWTPPASATVPAPAPPPDNDPVTGNWKWHSAGAFTLATNGSISGTRSGTWKYTCTTDVGRNYELHWQYKGWTDYVVLSADGKTLDGKSKQGRHVTANR